jgi:hypothetical protein
MIPRMAIEDLDPYELALYAHYVSTAWPGETCQEGVRATAEKTRMSKSKVAEARQALADKGYIAVTGSPKGTIRIEIVDRWAENTSRYGPSVHQVDTPCPPGGHPLYNRDIDIESIPSSPVEKPPVEKPEKPKTARTPTQQCHDRMVEALIALYSLDRVTISQEKWGELHKAAKNLISVKASPDELASLRAFIRKILNVAPGAPDPFTPLLLAKRYAEYRADREARDRKRGPTALIAPGGQGQRPENYQDFEWDGNDHENH